MRACPDNPPLLDLPPSLPYMTIPLFPVFFQMIQAIQVLRFHLLELEKVRARGHSLFFFSFFSFWPPTTLGEIQKDTVTGTKHILTLNQKCMALFLFFYPPLPSPSILSYLLSSICYVLFFSVLVSSCKLFEPKIIF